MIMMVWNILWIFVYFLIEVVALDKKGVSFIIDNEFLHNLIGEGAFRELGVPSPHFGTKKADCHEFGAVGF